MFALESEGFGFKFFRINKLHLPPSPRVFRSTFEFAVVLLNSLFEVCGYSGVEGFVCAEENVEMHRKSITELKFEYRSLILTSF